MQEEWKDIKGFEGLYKISNCGNIKSLRKSRLLKPSTDKDGYLKVMLTDNISKSHYFRVHRIVGIAFIPNPANLPHMNHKDGNVQNNQVTNLEWCTVQYNNQYRSVLNPDLFKNEDSRYAKVLNKNKVVEIYNLSLSGVLSQNAIAEKYGISQKMVSLIKTGKRWEIVTRKLKNKENILNSL